MQRPITYLLFCTPLLFAAQIYSEPSEKANVIAEIENSHEYSIKTQDWVEITDHTTKQKGWAKLSEMKQALSQNSQWSYQWHSTAEGSQQTLHYKPFNAEDINKRIHRVHQQHKKIMNVFDSFWEELDEDVDNQA